MKKTARWRDTGLLCSLSSGNVFSLNEGILQLQLFLYPLEHVTSGTTLSHKACRQVIRNLGKDCLLSSPFFILWDQNRQKCPAAWESDLGFVDTCIADWLTMTASCIRNNYILLAAPASTPTPAPQIRSPLIYRGRIFEYGGDWWLPSGEKLQHFIVKNKGKRHSKWKYPQMCWSLCNLPWFRWVGLLRKVVQKFSEKKVWALICLLLEQN